MSLSGSQAIWGWTAPVRGLLIGATLLGAGALLASSPSGDETPVPAPRLVIDPNTAPPRLLKALPRLGPALVGRIVKARQDAPFHSMEDLEARVPGVGPATVKALRPHLRFEPIEARATDAARPAPTMAHNAR